jgi:hypothetical protein
MKAYVIGLLAAGALALTVGVSDPAYAKHGWGGGGWHGGGWHGGGHWHGGWGPRWGWGWGPGWGWGWGPGVGIAIGPGLYGRRCWSNYYRRWVPCRWIY